MREHQTTTDRWTAIDWAKSAFREVTHKEAMNILLHKPRNITLIKEEKTKTVWKF